MSRSAIRPWPTESWTASFTTPIGSNCEATPCANRAVISQSANRAPALLCAGQGKGLRPFPRTPFLASGVLPSLRSGQIPLDHSDHLSHNQKASVASLQRLIGFLRNTDRLRGGITVRLQRNPQLREYDPPAFALTSGTAACCKILPIRSNRDPNVTHSLRR